MKNIDTRLNPSYKRSSTGLRMNPVAMACATLVLLTTGAYAQNSANLGSITVTGIRASIESSIAVKRNSDSIVEAISAEDIGKLPDVSIAESLARLPGLAGQRVAGRAQVISIRGMSPDFAGTLMNGREQVTTGDNRGVEYDQFPSELINGATVYKTPSASLIGQGLSGTVDLKSIRPLDFKERKVSVSARGENNSNGSLNDNTTTTGNRLSASYVDQFANNTIGVALGVAHLDTPTQELHYKAWGFSKYTEPCRADWGCGGVTGVPVGTSFLNGYEAEAVSRSQKRDGLMAVLEFKPTSELHSTVDLFYSKFAQKETMRGLMGGFGDNWNGTPGSIFTNTTTSTVESGPLITKGSVSNVVQVVRNDLNTRDDELKSIGWNTMAKLGDKWTGTADLNYSRADRTENVIESYAGPYTGARQALGTFNINLPTGSAFPSLVPGLNYADATTVKLSDPAGWGHDALWKKPVVSDEIKALRFEAKRELEGPFSGVGVGLNLSNRIKFREMNEFQSNLNNGRAPVSVSSDLLQPSTSLAFAGIPGVLAYDVMGVLNKYYTTTPQALDQVHNRNYTVSEKVTTGYVKLDIDSELAKIPVHGNLGVQVVNTDQSSTGLTRVKDIDSAYTRGTTYTDVLPSLNLNFDIGGDRHLRAGVAKTMARGRMDDMKASKSASVNNTPGPTFGTWSGDGGNPDLQPWRANSYDFSIEQYFGKRSYVAAAIFYKKLDSYIYTQTDNNYDFSGVANTSGVPALTNIGTFSTPANGTGGNMRGLELSGSLEGGLLTPSLDGFGLQASASFTDSSIHPDGPDAPTRLPGLSARVAGLTVYYEKNGFSSRISERYRSAFRGEINGLHNSRSFTDVADDKQVDFQIGYEFQTGSYKGLSILMQINNLTDSPYVTTTGDGSGKVTGPLEYNTYGRQVLLGVTYKL